MVRQHSFHCRIITSIFAFASVLTFVASETAAMPNPPDCRNVGAMAHNPHCLGNTGTHVTIPAHQNPVSVHTVSTTLGTIRPPVITVIKPQPTQYATPIPNPVPVAVPTRIPYLQPSQAVTGRHLLPVIGFHPSVASKPNTQIARAGGLGQKLGGTALMLLMHVQKHDGKQSEMAHVPPKPGNNFVPGYRAFYAGRDGNTIACVLAGLKRRVVTNQKGQVSVAGHSETLHFRSPRIAHLPGNRRHTNRCLVSMWRTIKKR